MKLCRLYLAALAVVSMTFSGQSLAAKEPVPLSAYGALPDVEDAAISPSGTNIAILMTVKSSRQLLIIGPDLKLIRRTGVGDAKVRDFDWIGDDQLLLITSQTEDLRGFTTDKAEFSVAHIIHNRLEARSRRFSATAAISPIRSAAITVCASSMTSTSLSSALWNLRPGAEIRN
ncbi:hypothetical protein [Erythrobacter sp. SD-21]|uniref:hypothetical protein n=1 Tax=Erythrobacter sp. SD-21 TaxID=161528 RepID=UPI001F23C2D4|nr:hypothetical protein [Erythrobacter sp. SD-21]